MTLPRSLCSPFVFALALLLAAVFFSGCETVDPAYTRELAAARTDCKPSDIVGIWVSQSTNIVSIQRVTVQILPDGTGRFRAKVIEGTAGEGVSVMEATMRWTYAGGGIWNIEMKFPDRLLPDAAIMQYTGRKLLFKRPGIITVCYVCVRASDSEAINAHLGERRNVKPMIPDPRLNPPQPTY